MCFLWPTENFSDFSILLQAFPNSEILHRNSDFLPLWNNNNKKKSDYLRHHFSSQCNAGVETRSQFPAWQPWTGVEHLSRWRLWRCWVWQSPSPALPLLRVSIILPLWVVGSDSPVLEELCPEKVSGWSSPSTTQGDIPLFFIFLAHTHPSHSALSPPSHERLTWHPNAKHLCLSRLPIIIITDNIYLAVNCILAPDTFPIVILVVT